MTDQETVVVKRSAVNSILAKIQTGFKALALVSKVLVLLVAAFIIMRAYYGGRTLGLVTNTHAPSPKWGNTQGFWAATKHTFWSPEVFVRTDWRGSTMVYTDDGYTWNDQLKQFVPAQ